MLREFMLDQLSRPRGAFAPLTALVLNSVNARTILAGISALELRPGMRAVEVGFGGGLSIPFLLRAVGEHGQVFVLETSDEMLARARRRFIVQRLQGRLRVDKAWVEALPLASGAFDAVMSLNTISFWTDVDEGMRELARVLAPKGRMVLGIPEPGELRRMGFASEGYRIVEPDKLAAMLPRFGLEFVELRASADGTSLLVATRIDDEADDGL